MLPDCHSAEFSMAANKTQRPLFLAKLGAWLTFIPMSRFSGLMSLWITCLEWQYRSARAREAMYVADRRSLKYLQRCSSLYSSPLAAYSRMRYTRFCGNNQHSNQDRDGCHSPVFVYRVSRGVVVWPLWGSCTDNVDTHLRGQSSARTERVLGTPSKAGEPSAVKQATSQ